MAACAFSSDSDDSSEALLSHVPLIDGAVETERIVTESKINVSYETDATIEQAAQHYRTRMSVPPWRVTTFDASYVRGSAFIVFRSDVDGLIASVRIHHLPPDDKTVIDLEISAIPTTTPSTAAS